jgi:hypothetical protein
LLDFSFLDCVQVVLYYVFCSFAKLMYVSNPCVSSLHDFLCRFEVPFYTRADISIDVAVLALIPKPVAIAIVFLFGTMVSYHVLKFWAYFYFPDKLKNEFFVLDSVNKSLKGVIDMLPLFNPDSLVGLVLNIATLLLGVLLAFILFQMLALKKELPSERTIMYTVPCLINFVSYFFVSTFGSKNFVSVLFGTPKKRESLKPASEELSVLLRRAALERSPTDPLEKLLAFDRLKTMTKESPSTSAPNLVYLPMPQASLDNTFSQRLGPRPSDESDTPEEGKRHEISQLPPSEGRIKGRPLGESTASPYLTNASGQAGREDATVQHSDGHPELGISFVLLTSALVFS